MKRKLLVILSILVVLSATFILFRFTPKTFGKNLSYEKVDHIYVFDGNTGIGFTIKNPDEIKYIVENVQGITMKKTGFSLFYEGYCLNVSYLNQNGKKIIPEFIINSESTIRKDPFFYACDGGLCFDYIKELESNFK